jgi:hypothetical protein
MLEKHENDTNSTLSLESQLERKCKISTKYYVKFDVDDSIKNEIQENHIKMFDKT